MLKSAFDRAVAIVGIGCRFPGGIASPRELWEFLLAGGDAITEVPADRWDADALFAADPSTPGRTYARRGGFLQGVRLFDPEFFGISPREAAQIDPQQRLLLETAHEAVEDAGERWENPAIRETGVFVGVFIHDYQHIQFADRERLGPHSGTGTAMSITANRISYAFDLKGPSVAVDTACSSSLVAIDLACKTLLNRECDFALAGGVNVILKPEMTIAMSKATMLSRDGRCKSFDARADGYVRGEGAGMLLLKRLADVVPSDRVYAIIRGSGVNSDGKTPGISVPNGDAQEALTRRVLADAGVSPASVGYVEAHGTGTPVGDPIEANALGRVFSEGRTHDAPALLLGSVKTNLGHLESASGVAGLIKAALAVSIGKIPPNLHFESGNPAIDFEKHRLRVASAVEEWPDSLKPRRAAVNSFGFGGTNAHILLEEPPLRLPDDATPGALTGPVLLPWGAHQEDALRALARQYAKRLEDGVKPQDLIYTVSQRRSHGAWRAAIAANSAPALAEQLRAFADGESVTGCTMGKRPEAPAPRPVMVFSGMGPQWWGMGRELLENDAVFRTEVERVDRAFANASGWSILNELRRDESNSRIQATEVAQPAIFAIQAGLAALWRHWGVEPAAIIGHSVGEIAALYVAGVLSLEDAAIVALHRSQLQASTAGSGGMLAANIEPAAARVLLAELNGAVEVAAINSPSSLTLSGELASLEQLRERLEAQGQFASMLRVEVPYHSAKMDPLREDLLAALSKLQPTPPRCPYYSTTDGAHAESLLGDAQYWWRNVRNAVLFADAAGAALADGHTCFLEVGPHPVLRAAIEDCAIARSIRCQLASSLTRRGSDRTALTKGLAELHVAGVSIDWSHVVGTGRLVDLPSYPWQHAEYWSESDHAEKHRRGASVDAAQVATGDRHALLGTRLMLAEPTWLQTLRLSDHRYIADHKVQGSVVFPGAGFLEMALQTLRDATESDTPTPAPSQCYVLTDVEIGRALYLADDEGVELQTTRRGDRWVVSGRAKGDDGWVSHAAGRGRREAMPSTPTSSDLPAARARCTKELPADYAYGLFSDVGLQYGPAFRGIRQLWYGSQECLARLEIPEELAESSANYLFQPALLDACLHTLFGALNLNGEDADKRGNVFLPVSFERLSLYGRAPTKLWSHARLRARSPLHFVADISVYDDEGQLVCEVTGLRCQGLETPSAIAAQRRRDWLLEYAWQQADSQATPGQAIRGNWLVLAPSADHDLVRILRERGARCQIVTPGSALAEVEHGFTLPGADPEALRKLLAVAAKDAPVDGIVHAWCVQRADEAELGASWTGQELGSLSVLHLVQALTNAADSNGEIPRTPQLWVATTLTQPVATEHGIRVAHGTVWGLRRAVANEHPALQARAVDLDGSRASLLSLADEIAAPALDEDELAFRDGRRFVHRLRRGALSVANTAGSDTPRGERMELRLAKPGDPRSIQWVVLPELELQPYQVEIEVEATGLNFKDVMKATGLFPRRLIEGNLWSRDTLGMECSGRIRRVGSQVKNVRVGQRVMALAPRTFASHAVTHSALVVENPGLGAEEAATIPVAFLTASMGLEHYARLQKGERVLIHAATGGVGLAALQVAAAIGAEIYATAGNDEKRQLLRAWGVRHVFDSRSLSFAREIREATQGEGVDVVLNSLAGDAITESLGLLRDYGRFIEIGKMDLDRDFPLGLRPFTRCLSFQALDLDRMLAQRVELCGQVLQSIQDRLANGTLKPLPVRAFPTTEASEAFQTLGAARHTGKLAVSISPATVDTRQVDGPRFRSDGAYVVTGGLSGFGRELARWLIERGAGHIVLVGRRGIATPGAREMRDELQAHGATVQIEACDVAKREDLRAALARIPLGTPLCGVFHAAAVLDDALLKNLEVERYRTTFAAKAVGAWNLHLETKAAPLEHFMCFSSMASVLGNQGSGNYCAANAFVDTLAHHRRRLGLPALTVNWGVIADVGMAADEDFYRQNLERNGLRTIHSRHCLDLLGELLEAGNTQTTVCPIDFDTWLRFNPAGRDGRLSGLSGKNNTTVSAARLQTSEEAALRAKLVDAEQPARAALAVETVTQILAQVLRTPKGKLDPARTLTSLGIDSLMAIEIKNRLESVGLGVSVTQLLNRNSANTLGSALLSAWGYGTEATLPTAVTQQQEAGRWLVCHEPRPEAELRLICFPYAGGGPSVYHHWSAAFPSSIEVRTVCLPGRGPRTAEGNLQSIHAAADAIVPEILQCLDRPFALFGHCMGAILMYEVAQRLEAWHGQVAARLFASGCMAPHLYNSPVVHEQENDAFLDVLRLISFSGTKALIEDEELRKTMFPLLRGDFRAVAEYGDTFTMRAALRAPITGLAADNDLFAAPKAMLAWASYTKPSYELLRLRGDHYFVESDRDTVTRLVAARLTGADNQSFEVDGVERIQPEANTLRSTPPPPQSEPHERRELAMTRHATVLCFPGAGVRANELELPSTNTRTYRAIEWRSAKGSATNSVSAAVQRAFDAVQPFLKEPVVLYGHCLGAIVAYELGLRLQQTHPGAVVRLVTAGVVGPHLYVAPDAHQLPDQKLVELMRVVKHPAASRLDSDPDFQRERLPMLRTDFEAMATYEYVAREPLDAPITAISLRHDLWSYPLRTSSWSHHTTHALDLVEMSGDHYVTLRRPEIIEDLLKSTESPSAAAE